MHRVFGIKEDKKYYDRNGAYIILIRDNKAGIVETQKGCFLLGGKIENNETYEQCIKRECLEEIGYDVLIKHKVCSAETYCYHEKIGYFHPSQVYYLGELLDKTQETIETDHNLVWYDCDIIKDKMFSEMQGWAIEQAIK